jgi:hypothetical protein
MRNFYFIPIILSLILFSPVVSADWPWPNITWTLYPNQTHVTNGADPIYYPEPFNFTFNITGGCDYHWVELYIKDPYGCVGSSYCEWWPVFAGNFTDGSTQNLSIPTDGMPLGELWADILVTDVCEETGYYQDNTHTEKFDLNPYEFLLNNTMDPHTAIKGTSFNISVLFYPPLYATANVSFPVNCTVWLDGEIFIRNFFFNKNSSYLDNTYDIGDHEIYFTCVDSVGAVGYTFMDWRDGWYVETFTVTGETMYVYYDAIKYHLNEDYGWGEKYFLYVDISGGYPPYNVIWYDKGIPLCELETYSTLPYLELWPALGNHSYGVSVNSSDTQYYINLSYNDNGHNYHPYITSSGAQEYSSYDPTQNILFNCIQMNGTVGDAGGVDVNQEGIGGQPLSGTKPADVKSIWNNLFSVFSSPIFYWSVLLCAFSLFAEIETKSEGKVFISMTIFGTIILSIFKIYPAWIPIVYVIIGGLIAFKMFSGK